MKTMEQLPPTMVFQRINLRENVSRAASGHHLGGDGARRCVFITKLGCKVWVSATPVREAMLELVRENLLIVEIKKDFRVRQVSASDLDEMTQIRLVLEPPMVRLMTSLIPETDILHLRELARSLARSLRRSWTAPPKGAWSPIPMRTGSFVLGCSIRWKFKAGGYCF